ncbi:MAG: DEAD/DEAH box helicase, partial [Waterburya sp.]
MKFEDYPIRSEIKKSLLEMGFKKPTDIQFKAIKNILKGEDVLAIAQTGTGKTAAFAIPIVHQLASNMLRRRTDYTVRCLIMVPTHELAVQIVEVIKGIAKYEKVSVVGIFG